ncbi:MAG: hypothetical protein IRY85_01710 [Micromonosporaceae bacterium]|nr:hypothetical protein [Micromonosporaceae bacterium]
MDFVLLMRGVASLAGIAVVATITDITAGALIGGLLLTGPGIRSTALVGGLITVLALALAVVEQRDARTRPGGCADRPTPRQETPYGADRPRRPIGAGLAGSARPGAPRR